jgi:hypothetical protein
MVARQGGATVRLLRVLGLLALAACGGGTSDSAIGVTHDPCAPLALVSAEATTVQQQALRGAEELWRDQGAPSLGLRAGTTLPVEFDDAAPAFHGLYDDTLGVIYINDTIEDPTTLSIVIAHELGHAFGLPHVTDRVSVMNPGNLTVVPDQADRAALASLWGACE